MSDGPRQRIRQTDREDTRTDRTTRFWPVFALLPVIAVGTVKGTGFTAIGGVDTTLLSVALLLVVSVVSFLRHPGYPVGEMLPYVVFASVVLLGVALSDPGEYQALKARNFFFLTGVIVACVPVLIKDTKDLRGLIAVWLVSGTAMALLVFQVGGSEDLYGRAGINEATLGPAYLCGAGLVVGATALGERLFPPIVLLPAITANAVALVSIGSRGPMLGTVLGFAAWVLLRGVPKARMLPVVVVFLMAVYLGFRFGPEAATVRLFVFEDPAREDLASIARAAFFDSPWVGLGWGDYVTVSWTQYPHNLFLEVAAELGIVGLLSFAVLLVAVAGRLLKNRKCGEVRILAALTCFVLVGGMVSYELTDRRLWIVLAACLVLPTAMRPSPAKAKLRRNPGRLQHSQSAPAGKFPLSDSRRPQ